jgi:hypothetical protein
MSPITAAIAILSLLEDSQLRSSAPIALRIESRI